MNIHILGICGTLMSGIAILAKQLGHTVSGSDANIYPPISTQLTEQNIQLCEGYSPEHLKPTPDLIIVGNTMPRGNSVIEYILNNNLPYISGAEWLREYVLKNRWVLGIAGTHGKTTTSGMLTWILHAANLNPGFLIGGIPLNFGISARLTDSQFFIIEADEYDTAFFDKRSKFLHYHPKTLILNNIEFDHGDIFADLNAIKRQFAHLLRVVPQNGLIIHPQNDSDIQDVLQQGCWTPTETFGDNAIWEIKNFDHTSFDVYHSRQKVGTVKWQLLGIHNAHNALAAIAAANHVGIKPNLSIEALNTFQGTKHRLEKIATINGKEIYDDFAHHPTAIAATISALRGKIGKQKLIVALELASNSMRTGIHRHNLMSSLSGADQVLILRPNATWNIDELLQQTPVNAVIYANIEEIVTQLKNAPSHTCILIMSNKNFGDLRRRLME